MVRGGLMPTEDYKEASYTIEIDWKGGTVWLNNHISKEKLVISERDAEYISDCFKSIEAKKNGEW
jgi:hypothetical protein